MRSAGGRESSGERGASRHPVSGTHAPPGAWGGGPAEAVVDGEAEAGGGDRGDGDAGGAGPGREVVDVVKHGEQVGGGLGEIARRREIEARAVRVDRAEPSQTSSVPGPEASRRSVASGA